MDITTGPARSWVRMLLALNDQLACTDSIVLRPLVALPVAEGLVRGFLLAADHPYSEKLAAPVQACRPVAVRTAIDIMEASPLTPLTTAMLAAECHISVRTLQEGFRRHVGMSPTAYLRRIRLRHAHEELRAADLYCRTLASVAYRWGFGHPGRFAAAHEAEYGEAPGDTLRAAR